METLTGMGSQISVSSVEGKGLRSSLSALSSRILGLSLVLFYLHLTPKAVLPFCKACYPSVVLAVVWG